ncbi:MAG: hypothetical protein E6J77_12140 [Deltaproteobacteria bacterium]|nr:MAG: hypothetical protein E6J77_12140 [Deltaproteobacteria bacterium]
MRAVGVRGMVATVLLCCLAAPLRAEDTARDFDPAVARRITPDEVQERLKAGEKPIMLDARASVGDVVAQGAVHVPSDRLEAWAKDVPRKSLIVAYCT